MGPDGEKRLLRPLIIRMALWTGGPCEPADRPGEPAEAGSQGVLASLLCAGRWGSVAAVRARWRPASIQACALGEQVRLAGHGLSQLGSRGGFLASGEPPAGSGRSRKSGGLYQAKIID